ncbi:MAG TPA: DUF6508 domain-containing protein [Acidimicrobiales bacterium]|nr:DUF6508 domain-containing protein [Acidimicrobiales bacterium]
MTDEHDPTDADIEALMRRAPADAWAALWSAVDELEHEDEHMTWGGGQQVDTTIVDGVERPVIQMPYAIYSTASERVVRSLYEVGAVVPFNWPDWDGVKKYRGVLALDSAPVADAVRMATAIVRADRFSEGTIGAMLEDGTLLAALRRLRRWHDEELVR